MNTTCSLTEEICSSDVNINTINEQIETTVELPSTLKKIVTKLGELREKLFRNKQEASQLYGELKSVEKLLERYVTTYTKQSLVQSSGRMPSGFASPTQVSDALCDFIERERGSLIPRTEFSKFLFAYIREQKLQSVSKPSVIIPDQKLADLLGREAMCEELTHFTIQKYITPHFIHTKNVANDKAL